MKNLINIAIVLILGILIAYLTSITVTSLLEDNPDTTWYSGVGLAATFTFVYTIIVSISIMIIAIIVHSVKARIIINRRMTALRRQQEAHDLHMFQLGLIKIINNQGEWLKAKDIPKEEKGADMDIDKNIQYKENTKPVEPQAPQCVVEFQENFEPIDNNPLRIDTKVQPLTVNNPDFTYNIEPQEKLEIKLQTLVNGCSTNQAIADFIFTNYGYYAAQLSAKEKRVLVSKGKEQEKIKILEKIMTESMTDPRVSASQYNRLDILFKTLNIREK